MKSTPIPDQLLHRYYFSLCMAAMLAAIFVPLFHPADGNHSTQNVTILNKYVYYPRQIQTTPTYRGHVQHGLRSVFNEMEGSRSLKKNVFKVSSFGQKKLERSCKTSKCCLNTFSDARARSKCCASLVGYRGFDRIRDECRRERCTKRGCCAANTKRFQTTKKRNRCCRLLPIPLQWSQKLQRCLCRKRDCCMAKTNVNSRKKCCDRKVLGYMWCGTVQDGDCVRQKECEVQGAVGTQPSPTSAPSSHPSNVPFISPTTLLSVSPNADNSAPRTNRPSHQLSEMPSKSKSPSNLLHSFSCIPQLVVPVGPLNRFVVPDWTCSGDECPKWLYSFEEGFFNGNVSVTQDPSPFTVLTGPQTVHVTLIASDSEENTRECNFVFASYDGTPPNVTIEGIADGDRLLRNETQAINITANAVDNIDGVCPVEIFIGNVSYSPGMSIGIGQHAVIAVSSDSAGNIGFATKIFNVLAKNTFRADAFVETLNCTEVGSFVSFSATVNLSSIFFDVSAIDLESVVIWLLGEDGLTLQNRPIFIKNATLSNDTWELQFQVEASQEVASGGCPSQIEVDGSFQGLAHEFEAVATVEYVTNNSSTSSRVLSSSASTSPSSSPDFITPSFDQSSPRPITLLSPSKSTFSMMEPQMKPAIPVLQPSILLSTSPSIESPFLSTSSDLSESPDLSPTKGSPVYTPSDDTYFEPIIPPSLGLSVIPSDLPTTGPSELPIAQGSVPTIPGTRLPSVLPSVVPSLSPSRTPSFHSSETPSREPTSVPSFSSTSLPSHHPSSEPTKDLTCNWIAKWHRKRPKNNFVVEFADKTLKKDTGSGRIIVNAKGGYITGGGHAADFWIGIAHGDNGEGNVQATSSDSVELYVYLIGFENPKKVEKCVPKMKCVFDPQFLAGIKLKDAPGKARIGGAISISSTPTCAQATAKGILVKGEVPSDQEYTIGTSEISATLTLPAAGKDSRLFTKLDYAKGGNGVGENKDGYVFVTVKSVIDITLIADSGAFDHGLGIFTLTPGNALIQGSITKSTPGLSIEYTDITKRGNWEKVDIGKL